jgi:hypothetical protein
VHFSIDAFAWRITVNATLSGVTDMLSKGGLHHQPCHDVHDILTPVIDRALVIVIPPPILESV